jgi:Ca2+:H+ antiporter
VSASTGNAERILAKSLLAVGDWANGRHSDRPHSPAYDGPADARHGGVAPGRQGGSGTLALLLAVVLLGNVIAAVHHAEVVALQAGEPFGTLVLALAVTVIEVGLIISMMLSGEPNPALLRDSVQPVVMLVLHGLAGLCIVVGAFRQRETEFRVEGANAFLAVLIPMVVLVLVLPNCLVSVPGPFYSPLQLAFVSVACLGLYTAFLFIQTNWH